jgi:hypothetical protein
MGSKLTQDGVQCSVAKHAECLMLDIRGPRVNKGSTAAV